MVECCTKLNFMIVGKRFALKMRRVVGVGGGKNVCLVCISRTHVCMYKIVKTQNIFKICMDLMMAKILSF